MVWKSGAIAIVRCEACSAVTAWQGEHTSRAYTRPASWFPAVSWAFAAEADPAKTPASITTRIIFLSGRRSD